jgi:hypothetical protein
VYCGYEFEIDHITPLAAGGLTTLENLALACSNCNAHKGSRTQAIDPRTGEVTRLFNVRQDAWRDHFEWSEGGTQIIGRTDVGRITVEALQMNNSAVVVSRAVWVSYGIHPPKGE